jgi:hypothetical protein
LAATTTTAPAASVATATTALRVSVICSSSVVLGGKGSGLNRVAATSFIVKLSDKLFKRECLVLAEISADIARLVRVGVFNCEDKLVDNTLLREH